MNEAFIHHDMVLNDCQPSESGIVDILRRQESQSLSSQGLQSEKAKSPHIHNCS